MSYELKIKHIKQIVRIKRDSHSCIKFINKLLNITFLKIVPETFVCRS